MKFLRIFIWIVLIFLMSTSVVLFPIENVSLSCPLTWGWLDVFIDSISDNLVLMLGSIVCIMLAVVSLYYSSRRYFAHTEDVILLVNLFLLLVFSNPNAAFFCPVLLAVICLIWAQELFMWDKYFLGALLISVSSLFYAPLIWLVLLAYVLLYMLTSFSIKNFIIITSGILVPQLYMLAFRYILFDDTVYFLNEYYKASTAISISLSSLDFPVYFELLCFFIISLITLFSLSNVVNRLKITVRDAIECRMLFLFFIAALFFLFSMGTTQPLASLAAAPFAYLFTFRTTQIENKKIKFIEVILILSSLVIARLSLFVN